ncbi:hypothetical protein B1B04_15450 [Lysinibacillus sp. KCTC 33748]|uniref:peptidogalycan biosysnthesis protein n=1 Tax=unclassified Lysinibacillus TaxID=2636778 RepID=UPI0009A7520B|nr:MULTISPECIES: peptidogalycan biosysnthesis protein [unclassified Lysinibacillus]OXS72691.1 hypothetical protein B1B04_15450 [Lysinibacillus sp. KCTC 33748]SKB92691.1 Peptidogalycan biosysnthesis/recognition [Lysinibacillus sp. AC-3]
MEIKLYRKYKDIYKDEAGFIESHFLNSSEISKNWFLFLEETLNDYEPIYLVGEKNGEILYFSTGYIIRKLDVGTFMSGSMKKAIDSLNKVHLNPLKFKVVFITNPLSSFKGIHGKNDLFLDEFIVSCRNVIYDQIKCDSVFVSNVYDELLNQKLKEKNFVRIPFYPNTVLNTEYNTFDDYLQSLKKKKRWDVRNKQKILQEYGAKIYICNCDEIKDYSKIYQLYNNTALRNDAVPSIINYSEEGFSNWINMNDCYRWVIIEFEGEIIAFALLVEDNDHLIFKHVGMDYKHSTSCFAYFNLYYVSIDYAINNGFKKMYCGPTTYDTKKSIGCQLIDTNSFISIRNKYMGKFVVRVLTKVFN